MTKNYGELVQDLESSTERWTRWAAAGTLGRLGDARAIEPLTTALRDEYSAVRDAAAKALGQLGDARAVEPLTAALGDEHSSVRKAAAEALDRLGWKPEENATGAAYWIVKRNWDQCLALGNLAVDSLIASLGDKDWRVRKSVAEALDGLKWKPQTVEQEVHYWIAKEDWYRCADVGEPAIEPLLNLISFITPIMLPLGTDDTIRHVLAEHFGSHPPVIEALRRTCLILCAEDERDMRELIGFTLRFAGFDVVLTADGFEAIDKALFEQPDLILLDVRMPKISGYEVCRRLKENPITSSIPIVFVSAKGQEGEIKQGLESGAVEYIVKPFAPDDLTSQVKDVLRRCELGIYEED